VYTHAHKPTSELRAYLYATYWRKTTKQNIRSR